MSEPWGMEDRPNIVIVGGGAAGAPIARQLSMKVDPATYNLILVTARPYYTHLPACIRMLVTSKGKLEDRAHITYNYNFANGNGRVIVGRVVSIEDEGEKGGRLMLNTGEVVEYSVLVLTPGSIWEGPLDIPDTKAETTAWLNEWREKFKESEDIVIVGGGAVGSEFAGEIRDLSLTKRITIVHNQSLLLNDAYPISFRKSVASNLRKRDIQIILEDSIEGFEISEASTIKTASGRLLIADLIILCRGPRPNTEFIASLGPNTTVETGHVKILPTLQLFRHPRIFAAGDIIDWDEQKQMSKYIAHADVVVRNVISVLKKEQPVSLYHGCYETIAIANGEEGGTSYYSFWGPTLQFGDWISSMVRSKHLLVNSARKKLGLKP